MVSSSDSESDSDDCLVYKTTRNVVWSDDEDENDIDDFRQRDIRAFFASDKTPPMTEWKHFYTDLVQQAATSPAKPFESFRKDVIVTSIGVTNRQSDGEKKKIA